MTSSNTNSLTEEIIKKIIPHINDAVLVDGETSTEGSSSPDFILGNSSTSASPIIHHPPALNVNAPAFTSISSMTPVIITKNVDIGNERWKPNATIIEENINTLPVADVLPQPFLGADGMYYWPAEVVNNFPPQTVIVEQPTPQQNTTLVNGHDPQNFGQPTTGTEVIQNTTIQKDMTPPTDLQAGELKKLIQLQFEYYFSRENLANDSYLVSQMDSDQYVSISTVAKFNQIRKLTGDMSLIVDALKDSPYVQLDETEEKVRANMKRCIVILREIPESTPMEEVKSLFAHPNCPQWTSFEFAHNDSWYVTFDCEEDAQQAYRHLREEVQYFKGRPLMARIKAKTNFCRTVYLPKRSNQPASSTTETVTTETTTTQFNPAPPPMAPFTLPASAVFPQPQTFPFYAAAPINATPLIHGGWIGPRPSTPFIPSEIRPKNNNYNKHNGYIPNKMNGQRSFYHSNKPRQSFRNNNYSNNSQRIPFHERNGFVDGGEEKIHSFRKSQNTNFSHSNHIPPNNYNRKDDARNNRISSHKKDPRGNIEESPRFQRLRERRSKDDVIQGRPPDVNGIGNPDPIIAASQSLNLDLAIENFPALPSPNSPNEFKTASTLKELATNALELSQSKSSDSKESSPTSLSDLSDASLTESLNSESKSTSSSISSTNGSSSSGYRSSPKISYAEMAQKPNKNNTGNIFDTDEKDVIIESLSAEIKNQTINNEPTKTENKNIQPAKSPRKNSRGSPRTSRHRFNQDNKNTEQNADQKINEKGNSNQNNVAIKETYASKFGKVSASSSITKNQTVQSPRTTSTNNKNQSTFFPRNTNTNNEKTIENLPSPKPLMSQIIKAPDNKLSGITTPPNNETQHQQQQQQNKQKSFSETIKNLENESKTVENEKQEMQRNSQD